MHISLNTRHKCARTCFVLFAHVFALCVCIIIFTKICFIHTHKQTLNSVQNRTCLDRLGKVGKGQDRLEQVGTGLGSCSVGTGQNKRNVLDINILDEYCKSRFFKLTFNGPKYLDQQILFGYIFWEHMRTLSSA